jgi:large subunit ribosomal protein L22
MDVIAKLRFYRQSPRKVRSVIRLLPGKTVSVAEAQLLYLPKAAAKPLIKLLRSAVANAEHNFKLKKETLHVTKAFVDEGPKLKRFRPAAFGVAHEILKRSSHVTLILSDGSGKTAKPVEGTKVEKPVSVKRAPKSASTKRLVAKDQPTPTVMEKKDEQEMPHRDVIRRGEE